MKRKFGILLTIVFLFSCKISNLESEKFEQKLFSKIEKSGKEFLETKEKKYLDFKELTEL